ncbi:hypothetical protein EGJ27_17470 [Pseudomonas sp. v388]|uniref:dermonecrotic toxin domain-containing protein n=1 Tax=Pseudomonas sp. v388 TaxID=2479849 RepID=UPI000F7B518A|nr:DUF6543 domain-containing protein [Pseudomonas sp. v388]RRV05604.1 hypothetical protein EGJ27_17470 [Pseudomonas sp. v388]
MPATPYFHSEALRQRFAQHLQDAYAGALITADELQDLQRLVAARQPTAAGQAQPALYHVLLEDGSPEPLGLVSALLIVRRNASDETLYLDTLAHGLKRFTDHLQLATYLRGLFAVRADLEPDFEYQVLEGSPFELGMWRIVDHQARSLRRLANDLQQLPSLPHVLPQRLAAKLTAIWPDGRPDLQAPLVQLVETAPQPPGASQEHVVLVKSIERLVLDALTGETLPAGQRFRFRSLEGRPLDTLTVDDLRLRLPDLKDDLEHLLGTYWTAPDRHGVTRRERAAQTLADGFSHQVWMQERTLGAAATALTGILGAALYALAPVAVSRLSLMADGLGPFKLVGLYLIHLEQGAYVLYSPARGIRHLTDWNALTDLIGSPQGRLELNEYLSLGDLATVTAASGWQLHGYPLDKPLFLDCLDAIIGLQQRNINIALQRCCNEAGELLAMLDDALDVRSLLDARLPYIDAAGRWWREPANFLTRWPASLVPAMRPPATPAASWMEQLTLLDSVLSGLENQRPGIELLARQVMSPYLAALGYPKPHEGEKILLSWFSQGGAAGAGGNAPAQAQGLRIQSLTDLLLERVSGKSTAPLPSHTQVNVPRDSLGAGQSPLSVASLEYVLSRSRDELEALCIGGVDVFYNRPWRNPKFEWRFDQIADSVRDNLLRLELAVARRLEIIAPSLLDCLQQVLDCPLSAGRRDLAQVYALRVEIGDRHFPLGLNIAWAIRQPGRIDAELLFWSVFSGLQAVSSGAQLQTRLAQRLQEPVWRSRWLLLFASEERQWLDQALANGETLTLSLARVEGDFLRRIQQDEQQRQKQEVAGALRQGKDTGLAALPFSRYVTLASSDDRLQAWLDALAIRIQNQLFSTALPDWLGNASLEDLGRYADVLSDYFRFSDPAQDYLSDIPRLQVFAHQQLLEALRRDFPDHDLDPRRIILTLTEYVPAPVPPGSLPSAVPAATLVRSESLVGYALNHFSTRHGGTLSLEPSPDAPLPAGLTADYLAGLVHTLDVGLRYQNLLAERFNPARADYPQRRERFMVQAPARLLAPALEMKLQGQLSQQAYDYIENVVTMPDGKARDPVHGRTIVLRPLTLLPRADMAADRVQGLFLIGPQDPDQGPVVLHSLFSESFGFVEFRDRHQLLEQLRREGPLQQLVLDRVEPLLRSRYANGGLIEAHIPWSTEGVMDVPFGQPGEVSLGNRVIEGNALRHLFETSLQLMQVLSRQQTVTSAQADWASFLHLMTLSTEQVLMFMPGKLGLLISLWQSQSLLRASVSSVSEQRWGRALSEFSAALVTLVSARTQDEYETSGIRPAPRPTVFSWSNAVLTPELMQRLRTFERHDVELASLQYDSLYNLYLDPLTQAKYAAVDGKVYQVHERFGVWSIRGDSADGPKLQLSQDQRWQLKLDMGLRGGAPTILNLQEHELQVELRSYMEVFAQGMPDIRAYSRDQARRISMGVHQALGYLQTALFNLRTPFGGGLAQPVQIILRDFFGVQDIEPRLIDGVRERILELFEGLSDPSLSILDSGRFVVGAVKAGNEGLAAFVFKGDQQRRLFLGEMFFSPPSYFLKNALPGDRAFNADDHFRVMALLHELSHLQSETEDIAYLDACAPPTDLLDDNVPMAAWYKRVLQELRTQSLSHRTPSAELFRTRNGGGVWRDFDHTDGVTFGKILRLTGQRTLAGARQAFLTNVTARCRVILGNADSVAMLISLLGRERFQR